jgi:antitoxin FitA
MAQLVLRNLPADLVAALEQRAMENKRSTEQEHRTILLAALRRERRLADVLRSMPNVGDDRDFFRQQ